MPVPIRKQAHLPEDEVPFPEIPAAGPRVREGMIPHPKLKLLEQVRQVMRFKHYFLKRSVLGIDNGDEVA